MTIAYTARSAKPALRWAFVPEVAALAAQSDFLVLITPGGAGTRHLVNANVLKSLGKGRGEGILVNVARGKVVDEPALIAALSEGRIAGAGLDVTVEEPLPPASELWTMPQVIVTPHSAGETRAYETNVVDLLVENLGRLGRGEALRNVVVF